MVLGNNFFSLLVTIWMTSFVHNYTHWCTTSLIKFWRYKSKIEKLQQPWVKIAICAPKVISLWVFMPWSTAEHFRLRSELVFGIWGLNSLMENCQFMEWLEMFWVGVEFWRLMAVSPHVTAPPAAAKAVPLIHFSAAVEDLLSGQKYEWNHRAAAACVSFHYLSCFPWD